MGSNPCKKLSLLGFAHPVEGSLFQVQGLFGKTALIRGRFFRRKSDCGFDVFGITCIKIVNLNICLCKE